jgi:hypothetical protein
VEAGEGSSGGEVEPRADIRSLATAKAYRMRWAWVTCWPAKFEFNGEGELTHRLTQSPLQGVGRRRPGQVSGLSLP